MKIKCTCGHERASHRHYRPGSDCAECPAGVCTTFRAANGSAQIVAAIAAASSKAAAVFRRRRRGPAEPDEVPPQPIDINRRSSDVKRSSA